MHNGSSQKSLIFGVKLVTYVTVAVIIATGTFFVYNLMHMSQSLEERYKENLRILRYVDEINLTMDRISFEIRMAEYRNDLAASISAVGQGDKAVAGFVIYANNNVVAPESRKELNNFYSAFREYMGDWEEVRVYLTLGNPVHQEQEEQLAAKEDQIRSHLQAFAEAQNLYLSQVQKRAETQARMQAALLLLVVVGGCLLILYLVQRLLSAAEKSIQEIEDVLNASMGINTGDVVVLENGDELMQIRNAIAVMNEAQARIIHRERLAALGNMTGGIAHNLKTPIMAASILLGRISKSTEGLIRNAARETDTLHIEVQQLQSISADVRSIIEMLKYMERITGTLSGYASDNETCAVSELDTKELVQFLDVLVSHEMKMRSCVLRTENHAEGCYRVSGSINGLTQVLGNIVLNAAQSYASGGGTVTFRIEAVSGVLIFTVADRGIGIDESIKGMLLHQFVTTKGNEGTGLGLYVSNQIIRGMFSGTISFVSEKDEGTSFVVRIPVVDQVS